MCLRLICGRGGVHSREQADESPHQCSFTTHAPPPESIDCAASSSAVGVSHAGVADDNNDGTHSRRNVQRVQGRRWVGADRPSEKSSPTLATSRPGRSTAFQDDPHTVESVWGMGVFPIAHRRPAGAWHGRASFIRMQFIRPRCRHGRRGERRRPCRRSGGCRM
jgi:hypothetical protein